MSVTGLILSNLHDGELPMLTAKRTMGAIPFGGRYRLLDFPLSAMVQSGISQIFVVAHHNYQSLMEHIGSGKDWDMARHAGGIHILPPFSAAYANPNESYASRMESLISILGLVERLDIDYVLCCDCDVLGAPHLKKLIEAHKKSGAPMTVAIQQNDSEEELDALHIWIASTSYLRMLLREAREKRIVSFYEELLRREVRRGNVAIYRFLQRFYRLRSLADYYRLHMLMAGDEQVRRELLEDEEIPILTKIQNSPPVKYGKNARVERSMIADGCVIEGRVINSVLFRGVHVGADCVVENAVLLEHCSLDGHAQVRGAILDKNVVLGGHVTLSGHPSLPFFVEEGRVIH